MTVAQTGHCRSCCTSRLSGASCSESYRNYCALTAAGQSSERRGSSYTRWKEVMGRLSLPSDACHSTPGWHCQTCRSQELLRH